MNLQALNALLTIFTGLMGGVVGGSNHGFISQILGGILGIALGSGMAFGIDLLEKKVFPPKKWRTHVGNILFFQLAAGFVAPVSSGLIAFAVVKVLVKLFSPVAP